MIRISDLPPDALSAALGEHVTAVDAPKLRELLLAQPDLTASSDHPKHVAVALANAHAREHDSRWRSCANCALIFNDDATCCSVKCGAAYAAYVQRSAGWITS